MKVLLAIGAICVVLARPAPVDENDKWTELTSFTSSSNASCLNFCKPSDSCFPDAATWDQLANQLTNPTDLFRSPSDAQELETLYQNSCVLNYTRATELYPQDRFTVKLPSAGLGSMGNYGWDDVKAPYHTGWSPVWSTDKRDKLGLGSNLGQTSGWSFIEATYPWQRQYGLHGLCMQNPDGQYMGGDSSTGNLNLPAFTVTARSSNDVAQALKFASEHQIQVVVKNTGHSYHSGSTAAGSLMIWTAFLPKYGTVPFVSSALPVHVSGLSLWL